MESSINAYLRNFFTSFSVYFEIRYIFSSHFILFFRNVLSFWLHFSNENPIPTEGEKSIY